MKDHEIITAKLNIHKERMEAKIQGMSKKEASLKQQALNLKAMGNLEGAYYKVKVQKEVKMAKRKMYGMLTVIENQLISFENAVGDAEFTELLKQSNDALKKLNKEIDMEEVKIAKELNREGKIRKEELNSLLKGEDEEDA